MTAAFAFTTGVLASNNYGTADDVGAGLAAFLIIAGIGLVLVFLLRSMNKQFRKIGPGDKDLPG